MPHRPIEWVLFIKKRSKFYVSINQADINTALVFGYLPENNRGHDCPNDWTDPVYPVVGPFSSYNSWSKTEGWVHAASSNVESVMIFNANA